MLSERNPALNGILEELLGKYISNRIATENKAEIAMVDMKKKYRIRKEQFKPIQGILEDAPPANIMVRAIRK
jgi:hypothetical protein